MKSAVITLLSGFLLIGSIADAAPPKALTSVSLSVVLTRDAQHIFQLSDRDHNQSLDQAEQDDAQARTKKMFSHYSTARTLGGSRIPAKVEEPIVVDLDRLNADDFVQMFLAKAAQYDRDLREKRVAKHSIPFQPDVKTVFVVNSNSSKQSKQDKDDRHADHRTQQPQTQQTQQSQGNFQPSAVKPRSVASNVHPHQQVFPHQHMQTTWFDGQPMHPPMHHVVPGNISFQHLMGGFGGGGFGGGTGGSGGNPHHSGHEKDHKHHEK